MIDIIVKTPEGYTLRNPIWKVRSDSDFAFVDLLREVCQKIEVDPREFKVQLDGADMQNGALCLNFLDQGDTVELVER